MVDVLIDILQDTNLDLVGKRPTGGAQAAAGSDPFDPIEPPIEPSTEVFNGFLKIFLVRKFWEVTRAAISSEHLATASERILACLMKNEEEFTEGKIKARALWASFCADIVSTCHVEVLRAFWGYTPAVEDRHWEWHWNSKSTAVIWAAFAQKWKEESDTTWEGGVSILGIPFM